MSETPLEVDRTRFRPPPTVLADPLDPAATTHEPGPLPDQSNGADPAAANAGSPSTTASTSPRAARRALTAAEWARAIKGVLVLLISGARLLVRPQRVLRQPTGVEYA